ncbi:hypothetical protein K523DRAFT_92480 [Schizophyllum commune Tattone D]|nr:hypothetical protein K523DRAFT_92480 [Schizophyllum commune Tattone D]
MHSECPPLRRPHDSHTSIHPVSAQRSKSLRAHNCELLPRLVQSPPMTRLGGGRWMPSSAVFLKALLALVFPRSLARPFLRIASGIGNIHCGVLDPAAQNADRSGTIAAKHTLRSKNWT